MPAAIRITVLLPVTTTAHRRACKVSLDRLRDKFGKGWTLSWFHNKSEELSEVPYVGYPTWSGGWLAQHGLDHDTHLLFVGHLEVMEGEQAQANDLVEILESEIHAVYARHRGDGRDVLQNVLFIEAAFVQTNSFEPQEKQMPLLF